MKKFPLIIFLALGLTSVVVSAKEFTIQILTTNQKISMETLLKKAKNKGIQPEIFLGKNGRYILTVGIFNNRTVATKELSQLKIISKDAFIRPIDLTRVAYLPVQKKEITGDFTYEIVEKQPSVAASASKVYLYDCSATSSGVVVPADETATDIIVRYNCNKPAE